MKVGAPASRPAVPSRRPDLPLPARAAEPPAPASAPVLSPRPAADVDRREATPPLDLALLPRPSQLHRKKKAPLTPKEALRLRAAKMEARRAGRRPPSEAFALPPSAGSSSDVEEVEQESPEVPSASPPEAGAPSTKPRKKKKPRRAQPEPSEPQAPPRAPGLWEKIRAFFRRG